MRSFQSREAGIESFPAKPCRDPRFVGLSWGGTARYVFYTGAVSARSVRGSSAALIGTSCDAPRRLRWTDWDAARGQEKGRRWSGGALETQRLRSAR